MSWPRGKVNLRRWWRVRRKVLQRDGWRCRHCGRPGNEVDHVIPMDKGGAIYDMDNLQVLSRPCHIEKSRRERQKRPMSPEREAEVKAWRRFMTRQ